MKNITYLFGAGASAGTIPIVDEIPKELEEFYNYINPIELKTQSIKIDSVETSLMAKEFKESVKWLLEESHKHLSVDTYAKKLSYIGDKKRLNKLKLVLSVFFIYLQFKKPLHKRYDSFLASLLDAKNKANPLPKQLKILSWNYDFQFEKAVSNYIQNPEIEACWRELNIFPRNNYQNQNVDSFSMYKLNGTTHLYNTSNGASRFYRPILENVHGDINDAFWEETLFSYYTTVSERGNLNSLMKFAWEDDPISKRIIEYANQATASTEILIIIGYSFPYFNRTIDRELIKRMKNLKKVYFQDINPEIIRERFLAIRDDIPMDRLLIRKDVGQFLIPDEL